MRKVCEIAKMTGSPSIQRSDENVTEKDRIAKKALAKWRAVVSPCGRVYDKREKSQIQDRSFQRYVRRDLFSIGAVNLWNSLFQMAIDVGRCEVDIDRLSINEATDGYGDKPEKWEILIIRTDWISFHCISNST